MPAFSFKHMYDRTNNVSCDAFLFVFQVNHQALMALRKSTEESVEGLDIRQDWSMMIFPNSENSPSLSFAHDCFPSVHPIHLATKVRNRMLSSTATMLLMGKQGMSIDTLHHVLSSSSKFFHGLVSSDLNQKDHQNYTSRRRISRDEVFQALQPIS